MTELAAALVAFQAEVTNPKNTATNPHFKSGFAPLPDLLAHYRPLLTKHGLAVVQKCASGSGTYGVATVFVHKGGASMDCGFCCFTPQRNDPNGAASAITYARRYSLCAALGIASEDDDDGAAASKPPTATADDVLAMYVSAKDATAVKAADNAAKGVDMTKEQRTAIVKARKDAIGRVSNGAS